MYEYRVHTLVDITDNGILKKAFPFKSLSGDVIHDKHSLAMARNQNSNFTTMLQLLQMRANVTWEHPPKRMELQTLGNHAFGSFYEGKHTTWHFQFFSEQPGLYGDDLDPIANIVGDFHQVPIINSLLVFPLKEEPSTTKSFSFGSTVIFTYFSFLF